MKIEMHAHTKPGSICAHHSPEEVPEMFVKAGYGAVVLTNHYYPDHLNCLSFDIKTQPHEFVKIYHRTKIAAEKLGLKVFFGAEVKLINVENTPEFLLYGISEEDFISSFPLYSLSQKELYDFCCDKNILMVQAHPYRAGYTPAELQYMHGVEVYNPHPLCDPKFKETFELSANMIKTAGSDFHIYSQAGDAGMIIPDYISDQFMLRDWLMNNPATIFSKQDIIIKDDKLI